MEIGEDERLMMEFASGSTDAFKQLVRRHEKPLLNFFYRLVADYHLAEDCVQEVFRRLVRARSSYKPMSKFTTFMYRIAKNYWIDIMRRRAVSPRPLSLDVSIDEDGESLGAGIAGVQEDPGDAVEREDMVNRVQEAVQSLSEEKRMILTLSWYRGMTYREIAEVAELPLGTVKSRIHSAVRSLRNVLTKDANGE